jgi:hypothetical protein
MPTHPFAQEGYNLMAAAYEVHTEIGDGLLEEVYQESLEQELKLRSIPFTARQELAIFYKGRELKKPNSSTTCVSPESPSATSSTSAHSARSSGSATSYPNTSTTDRAPLIDANER